MSAPLFGLVLAGGASSRMQRDKAVLDYHGRPQLQWAFDLVSRFCVASFVSVRTDQREDPVRSGFPQIIDRQPGMGPIAGIMAALSEHPHAAWLVVACDLPFLTPGLLHHLIEHRDADRIATAYRSSHDALPEPLCALWEPAAREALRAYIETDRRCPRKFLMDADIRLLDLPDPRALDNINTPQEFVAAADALEACRTADTPTPAVDAIGHHGTRGTAPGSASASSSMRDSIPGSIRDSTQDATRNAAQDPAEPRSAKRTLRVQYYAILREQAGRNEETIETQAMTPTQLYAQLSKHHPFELTPSQLKVALNSEFADWNTTLRDGDTVVFIPPVAGG